MDLLVFQSPLLVPRSVASCLSHTNSVDFAMPFFTSENHLSNIVNGVIITVLIISMAECERSDLICAEQFR